MKKWFIALLLPLVLAACSSGQTSGISVDSSTQKVVFGDNVLGGRLSVDQISTQDNNGLVRGIVSLTSKFSGDQQLQYRFYWYDDQGLEVNGSDSPWRTFIVRGLDTMSVQGVAMKPEATQFRIQIRTLE
ncbi:MULTISPECIES: YcfL family protein [Aliivibrio]|jgi:uncharacterized protein YcfL|uniref:YcfL protein: an outer membrane lipoprotein that is part of a salvage cluster n=3 Tax=Aliivibrio TaxID=511678 RepID=A0A1B9P0X7_ALILO|nr:MULTISPECIES: YcfL family protein [Aliivibrio]AZL84604.1 DUF1425 domain-containing protein [Aliivibrio salmonicida]MBB1314730.1 YcfL family protein [Aliivibrio sp. SR45-2]OCH22019.1 hypothetical protein A6E04_09190 [Aliivibrio logei]OEF19466.1 hypothetical protein A1Q5_17790 [Aliivibrio logei 5S-186]CAQ78982.1 putative lipoprotein [Aliivibrio salmonicida LFI1238]